MAPTTFNPCYYEQKPQVMKNSEAEERARLRVEERLRMAPTDYSERAVAEEALRARDPLRRLQEMRGNGNEVAARLIETLT